VNAAIRFNRTGIAVNLTDPAEVPACVTFFNTAIFVGLLRYAELYRSSSFVVLPTGSLADHAGTEGKKSGR
jgi:hypothetical protein